jgi:hypothetical protein
LAVHLRPRDWHFKVFGESHQLLALVGREQAQSRFTIPYKGSRQPLDFMVSADKCVGGDCCCFVHTARATILLFEQVSFLKMFRDTISVIVVFQDASNTNMTSYMRGHRPLKRSGVFGIRKTNDEDALAVCGQTKISAVEHVRVDGIAKTTQRCEYCLQRSSLVVCQKTSYIFQEADGGFVVVQDATDVEKQSALGSVLKPFSLSDGGETLAWEPTAQHVVRGDLVSLYFGDVALGEHPEVCLVGFFGKFINVTRKDTLCLFERTLQSEVEATHTTKQVYKFHV